MEKRPVELIEVQKMIGTSLELFKSLVDIFTEEAERQITSIEKSILNNDPLSLDNSAHNFKSSLATLGALKASSLAGQLEMIGKNGKIDGSAELFRALKIEYQKVVSYFESRQWVEDWDSI